MRVAGYFLVFAIPLLVIAGARAGAWYSGAAILFVFGVVPLLDAWVGRDARNPEASPSASRWHFDVPLVTWVIVQLLVEVWLVARTSHAITIASRLDVSSVLAIVSLGLMTGGIGITIAHELMHRPQRWARALAELLMSSVAYAHFCIEHVHGHHRNVATPEDPASSRLGESLWAFLPRTVVGGFASAWGIEAERMRRAGRPALHPSNRMLRYAAVQAVVIGLLAATLGAVGVAVYLAQAAVAIAMLEIVNYVEHYGLVRARGAEGRYERVAPRHSWNANHRVSNWLLFNLQRHSDHHYLASRPYDALRHHDDVPQLPAGYATMVLLALVPPLWRRVMDPRVAAARAEFFAPPAAAASRS